MSGLAFFISLKESRRFLFSLPSLTAFLATPMEIPQAGSSHVSTRSDPCLAK
jgi:hypothetical protein